MGDSSDASLLALWLSLRRCGGYGEPQWKALLCSLSSLAEFGDGVLSNPATRSGSLGGGSGGISGDASPSAVDAEERAGDAGEDWCRSREPLRRSCADARGGV